MNLTKKLNRPINSSLLHISQLIQIKRQKISARQTVCQFIPVDLDQELLERLDRRDHRQFLHRHTTSNKTFFVTDIENKFFCINFDVVFESPNDIIFLEIFENPA